MVKLKTVTIFFLGTACVAMQLAPQVFAASDSADKAREIMSDYEKDSDYDPDDFQLLNEAQQHIDAIDEKDEAYKDSDKLKSELNALIKQLCEKGTIHFWKQQQENPDDEAEMSLPDVCINVSDGGNVEVDTAAEKANEGAIAEDDPDVADPVNEVPAEETPETETKPETAPAKDVE